MSLRAAAYEYFSIVDRSNGVSCVCFKGHMSLDGDTPGL